MASLVSRITNALAGLPDSGAKSLQLFKASLVPDADASQEEKREAQQARAEKYGIEALEGQGERLSWPANYPTDLDMYGDPVNLKYPFETVERARNARARFKQNADVYSKKKSKTIVHTRIVERLLALDVKPGYDSEDPLDKLLPSEIKDKLTD